MIERMVRAARLQPRLYEEVEHDQGATGQALLIVVLAAISGGLGRLIADGVPGFIAAVVGAVVFWALITGLAYLVGTRLLATRETSATWGQVLRTVGFAYTPGVLSFLGVIPILGPFLVVLVIPIWIAIAAVIGIRQALDFDTVRAIGTGLIAYVVWLVVASIFIFVTGVD